MTNKANEPIRNLFSTLTNETSLKGMNLDCNFYVLLVNSVIQKIRLDGSPIQYRYITNVLLLFISFKLVMNFLLIYIFFHFSENIFIC